MRIRSIGKKEAIRRDLEGKGERWTQATHRHNNCDIFYIACINDIDHRSYLRGFPYHLLCCSTLRAWIYLS